MYQYGKASCDGYITSDKERAQLEFDGEDYDGYWEPEEEDSSFVESLAGKTD